MRWSVTLGLLVAVPKCIVCIAAALGLAAGLGGAGTELCGGTGAGTGLSFWIAAQMTGTLALTLIARSLARDHFTFARAIFRNKARCPLNQSATHARPVELATP